MRLTVSQYLARLPDRTTNTFLGECSIGQYLPDSWRVVSRFVALRSTKRRSREMARPTGVKEGLSAESEAGVRSNGWMGGVGGSGR